MFLYNIIEIVGNILQYFKIERNICKKYNYEYTQYFSGHISEYGEYVEATLRQYCYNIK